jgi:hypothetical protein
MFYIHVELFSTKKCCTAQQRTLPTDRQQRFYRHTPIPLDTHKHVHARDRLPQPVLVYCVQHSTCTCTLCTLLYVHVNVQCTCKMHCTCTVQCYSRVVPLNDLPFTYTIVHSYTPNECSVRGEYEYSLQTEAGYRAKSSKKEQEGPSTSFDNRCFVTRSW